MPTIPLYAFTAKPSTPANVRADPDLLNSKHAAQARLGGAVAALGSVVAEAASKMQDAQNFKELTNLDLDMQQAWGDFTNGLNTSSDESKWSDQWKTKLQGVVSKYNSKSVSPVIKDKLQAKAKDFEISTSVDLQQKAKRIGIDKAKTAGMTRTQLLWQNGDEPGATAALNEMAELGLIHKEEVPELVMQGHAEMQTAQATRELNELRNLPPSQAKAALQKFSTDLGEKGEDGKPMDYDGLPLGTRIRLQDAAEAQARAFQQKLDTNGRRIISDIRLGRATLETLTAAVQSGELDEETAKAIRPDVEVALADHGQRVAEQQRIVRERSEADARQAQGDARSRQSKFDQMLADVSPLGKQGSIGEKDIVEAMKLQQITADQGAQLRSRLKVAARSEQVTVGGAFETLRDEIRGMMSGKVLGSRDPDESEYQDKLGMIATAKVSQPTRLKLVEELLAVRLADINDLEEGQSTKWLDRDISQAERDVRRELVGEIRGLLPNLGDVGAGDALFASEERVRGFFDSAPGGKRSQGEIDAFKKQLLSEVQQSAGSAILRDVFDF